MNTHANKTQERNNHVVLNEMSQRQNGNESTFQFANNRPETIVQRKLQKMTFDILQANQALQLNF